MWRKTRRVSKKRRRHTKKRRNVKRTHKYKYLRGGLGENDYANIGISTKFSFSDDGKLIQEKMVDEFKKYVFGSEEHAQKWEEILRLCADKKIPFYILTSGNKVGIIRTLQLLELADYVTEVLCNNRNALANPQVVNRTFDRMNKYQIIRSILAARCDQPDYTGIFIDNDKRQMINNELCNNVGFIHATGDNINIYDVSLYPRTIFMTYVLGLSRHQSLSHYFDKEVIERMYINNTNLVHTTVLDDIIRQLNSNPIQILFADFDGTMSPWGGALPFHLPAFERFFNPHFKVVTSDL
jgi:hypothetical protein